MSCFSYWPKHDLQKQSLEIEERRRKVWAFVNYVTVARNMFNKCMSGFQVSLLFTLSYANVNWIWLRLLTRHFKMSHCALYCNRHVYLSILYWHIIYQTLTIQIFKGYTRETVENGCCSWGRSWCTTQNQMPQWHYQNKKICSVWIHSGNFLFPLFYYFDGTVCVVANQLN